MRDIVQKSPMKPTYKDYQSYLQSYKNGTSSGSLSQTSSTSSLQSTENEAQRIQRDFSQKSFTENNNKFSGVIINEKVTKQEQKKPTMKSELFITINQPEDVTTSKNSFSEIKQRFNEQCKQQQETKIKVQKIHQNSCPNPNQKGPLSPKSAENNVVSDQMIYAKTAVLEELLTTSPSLKKVQPTFPKVESTKIYNKPATLRPPSLPTTKPSNFAPPKTTKMNDQTDFTQEQLLKELQTLVLMQENANLLNGVPEPPSFVAQQLKAKYSESEPTTTTVVPVAEGVSDVDKSDPNVKTLVYNTYRGMLGAYNNKANNMVSTLPRNAVVQDQGVSKQVESMASTGCLNNINGRVNPKSIED